VVQFFEFRLSWRVGEDDEPPIVKLVARDEPDEEGQAVFEVSEFSERLRLWYNRGIRRRGGLGLAGREGVSRMIRGSGGAWNAWQPWQGVSSVYTLQSQGVSLFCFTMIPFALNPTVNSRAPSSVTISVAKEVFDSVLIITYTQVLQIRGCYLSRSHCKVYVPL
jgi:hypothetical protein